ncbi:putative dehydrogenase [Catenulispora sp. GP43]|uniref:Gfo/Idh/MocA family protein n=1 Tax=Catenulispora sp. GP43 TaxID=3156263 RepID=UPI0035165E8D
MSGFATITTPGPLRAVIVGAGFMGRNWAREIARQPDTELVGWVDLDEAALREAVKEAGSDVPENLAIGTDLAALLADLAPDIVFNSSPPAAHRTVTTAALEDGCAVLSEKPMAMSLAEARDLCAVSERTGRLLAVTQDRRQLSGTRALKEAARRLAPLTRLEIDFRLPHRAGPYVHLWDEPLLREMAIHLFDAARAVTGADARSVFCTAYRTPWSWYPGNDSAEALFQMDGGLHFAFTGCWTARSGFTSWTGRWYLEGAGGSAVWDGVGAPVLTPARQEGQPEPPSETLPVEPQSPEFPGLAEVLAGFVRALRTGEAPDGECHDNLRSLAMVEAAVASSQYAQPVVVEN